jgi:soluble lytic murein transglycosylase
LKRKTNINNAASDNAGRGGLFGVGASLLVIFFLACCLPDLSRADIYRFIDSEGVVHYTNTPTASGFKLYLREKTEKLPVGTVSKVYDAIIQKAQVKYGIASSLIKAVIHAESGFNPRAVSKKGAKGLMQIMPENYRALSVSDPFDPAQNIMGGTRYLKQLLNRYDAKLPLALAAYNAGPTAVDLYRRVPPYTETQNYVQKVMTLYNRYKNI